uniref:Lipocalin n=1 Tax=Amblyomma americanum TaxID=6943 RepID=A0A0C9SEW7_AMBAM
MKKQMGMIFLLTFVLLESLLCRASTEDSPPIWANETRLGKYQDPWKILNQSRSEVYYLVNSTFSSADYLWGSNFTCVSVRFSNISAEWRKSEFIYRNASSGNKTFNLDLNTTVSKTYNYTKPNAIQ